MKTTLTAIVMGNMLWVNPVGADQAATPAIEQDPLIAKYDANGNGKIDVEERRGYVHERALRLREESRREQAQIQEVPVEVRPFIEAPNWSVEKVAQYDKNHNGRIDPDERMQERADAIAAAWVTFRRLDTNHDGKVDANERRQFKKAPTATTK